MRRNKSIYFFSSLIALTFFLLLCFINQTASQDGGAGPPPVPALPPEYEYASLPPPAPPSEVCLEPFLLPPSHSLPLPPPPPSTSPPLLPPCPKISPRVVKAARVIQSFKKLIDVDPLGVTKTWKGDDACKYKGFHCAKIPDQNRLNTVAGVDFSGFGFANSRSKLNLEGFLNELEDLAFYHANSNNFTGTVPDIDYLTKVRFLYELDLSNNKLTGPFPREVLKAKNLTFLDLRFNQLNGSVPPALFNLDVQVIYINNNQFQNPLPSNLGSTPALYLSFANNRFTGSIPKSIGQASDTLIEVLFLNNYLSGCLPYEIGMLKKAITFDASRNFITGPIPQSFACLHKINILNLARNRLFGAVPESLCKLGSSTTGDLRNLTLSENYFTQVGPECRKLIAMKYLDVNMNCILDLPNQRSKVECQKFFSKMKTCPDEKSMAYVPCQNQVYHSVGRDRLPSSFSDNSPRRTPSSVTYATLTRSRAVSVRL